MGAPDVEVEVPVEGGGDAAEVAGEEGEGAEEAECGSEGSSGSGMG